MNPQYSTAMRAVWLWNLLPLVLIASGVLIGATKPDDKGGWAMLFAIVLAIFGSVSLTVSITAGLTLASVLVRRRTARGLQADTAAVGTLAAFLGWLIGFGFVAALFTVLVSINQAM